MHYNVTPRYTPGSPASVDLRTAEKVACEEQRSYLQAKSGAYGNLEQDRALELGIEGIVEKRIETRWGWLVEDLITGSRCMRQFKCECGRDEEVLRYPEEARSRFPHRRGCAAARVSSPKARERLERWRMLGR